MTNEEAISLLQEEQRKPRNIGCEMWIAFNMAKQSLRKQIPRKRLGGNRCPICDAFADGDYCWRCGQRLCDSTVNEKN